MSTTVNVTTEGDVTVGVEYNPVAGSGTDTNIGITRTSSAVVVTSSSGTDGTILAADGTNAGVFTSANYTKLAGISGTNTGDQNIFQNVAVAGQSTVVADTTTDTLTLVAGTNITLTTDAATDTITITASGGGGSGDVVGPASSTDNAFARFDSTTGKLLQNSTATLDDVGLASVDGVQFSTTPTSTVGQAKAVWDATDSCLSIGLNASVNALVGTDSHVRVYNESASTMTVMQVVRQSGSSGTRLSVELALANTDSNSATTIGVVAQTIASHAQGFIQTAGLLQGVNTNAFNEGDTLWLSAATAGLITNVKPTAPNHGVRIGYCIKKAGAAGIILIDILNGFELDELHDVKITGPIVDNSFLTYDTTSAVWINEAPSAARSSIGLGNVTDDAQTKAAIVPNTAPTAGQLLVGNAGGTAYAPVSLSSDATVASTGALTLATVNSNVGAFGSATKASVVTVNAKGLVTAVTESTVTPAVGSVTGLGTGVATALAVNVGTAGAPVVLDGALGTPSSGSLASCTGLPVSTGVSGFGTNVAAALAVAIGTAGAPVTNGGALGTPSSGVATNLTGTASGLTAGGVTTNANLTGVVTSVGNATAIADAALAPAKVTGTAAILGANSFTGAQTLSVNGAASTPPLKLTGTIFTGGSATTTKPAHLIEPAGTTSTGWSTLGTAYGANMPTGFQGRYFDGQINGVSKVYLEADGNGKTTLALNAFIFQGDFGGSNRMRMGGAAGGFYFEPNNYMALGAGTYIGWCSAASGPGNTSPDLIITREAAATLRMGSDAAGVTSQHFKSCNRITSNGAGANLTISGGNCRGTTGEGGVGGSLIFATYAASGTSNTVGTLTTRLTINTLGEIIPVLPTSSAGLTTGALWNNLGIVTVA